MTNNPLVSIIIIYEEWGPFSEESLPYYSRLNYPNYEVFAFSTEKTPKKIQTKYPKIKFIYDKKLKNMPAERRDLAMKYANGEFFAFIDDDAFPSKDWLRNATKNFRNENVVAVGGPGITPKSANVFEKTSGWISASTLGGFGTTFRFIPQKKRYVDDYPSMNLIVRAEDFKKVGGFDSDFYPGEDTKLCLDLTKNLKKKIVYDPLVIVYHHKRPLFKKHLTQNGRYGLHRGHFARILPQTSRRLFYFIPSLFFLGFIGGFLVMLFNLTSLATKFTFTLENIFLSIMGLYMIFSVLSAIWVLQKSKNIIIALLFLPGVLSTHLWYGLRFIEGYLKNEMRDTYGRTEK